MTQQVIITLEFPTEGRSEEVAAIRQTLEAKGWRSWSVVASFWLKEWPCRVPKAEIQKAIHADLSLAAIAAKLSVLEATVLSLDSDPHTVTVSFDVEEPPPPSAAKDEDPPRGPCA